jgi:hypothetical protein
MFQFGDYSNQKDRAYAFTTAAGYDFKDLPMDPQFWVGYDLASGDPNAGTGATHETFNQLFPFGHYYLGFIDVVGRQNIHDLNGQFAFYPMAWITGIAQYHVFNLDSGRDALYAANGSVLRKDPTGRAGTDVGQELDLLLNFHLTNHQDVLLGYSHLYSGPFIKQTGSPLSPDYFYAQYTYRW